MENIVKGLYDVTHINKHCRDGDRHSRDPNRHLCEMSIKKATSASPKCWLLILINR